MIYTYRPDGKVDTWGKADDLTIFYYTTAGNLSGIGPASSSTMWITYKYEPGKGNADYLFSDPLKKLYGVCETYLAW